MYENGFVIPGYNLNDDFKSSKSNTIIILKNDWSIKYSIDDKNSNHVLVVLDTNGEREDIIVLNTCNFISYEDKSDLCINNEKYSFKFFKEFLEYIQSCILSCRLNFRIFNNIDFIKSYDFPFFIELYDCDEEIEFLNLLCDDKRDTSNDNNEDSDKCYLNDFIIDNLDNLEFNGICYYSAEEFK